MKEPIKKKVVSAWQSPLNKSQWSCDLECGHKTWVTSIQKPKSANCYACTAERENAKNNA